MPLWILEYCNFFGGKMAKIQKAKNVFEKPSDENIVIETSTEQGFFNLPISSDQLKEFLSSLISSNQHLNNSFSGSFCLNKDAVYNFFHVLEQRMTQNNASLLDFESKIYFSDGSHVHHESFEDFVSYNEVKPIVPIRIELSLAYLIIFPEHNTPKRQDVNIAIDTRTGRLSHSVGEDYLAEIIEMKHEVGKISYSISHTSRTWASDIDSLLSSYIENHIHQESKLLVFSRKWKSLISYSVMYIWFVALLLFTIQVVAYKYQDLYKDLNEKAVEVSKASMSQEALQIKVNLLLQYQTIRPKEFKSTASFVVVALVIGMIFTTFSRRTVLNILASYPPSFIILNEYSQKKQLEAMAKRSKSLKVRALSVFCMLIIGVLSNIFSHHIIKYFS